MTLSPLLNDSARCESRISELQRLVEDATRSEEELRQQWHQDAIELSLSLTDFTLRDQQRASLAASEKAARLRRSLAVAKRDHDGHVHLDYALPPDRERGADRWSDWDYEYELRNQSFPVPDGFTLTCPECRVERVAVREILIDGCSVRANERARAAAAEADARNSRNIDRFERWRAEQRAAGVKYVVRKLGHTSTRDSRVHSIDCSVLRSVLNIDLYVATVTLPAGYQVCRLCGGGEATS